MCYFFFPLFRFIFHFISNDKFDFYCIFFWLVWERVNNILVTNQYGVRLTNSLKKKTVEIVIGFQLVKDAQNVMLFTWVVERVMIETLKVS